MAAEAVEGGASLFRQESVGLGLDIRVQNLSRRKKPRAGRSPSQPKLAMALDGERFMVLCWVWEHAGSCLASR
jgi:hypothetical protein